MKIGNYTIQTIISSHFRLDGGAMFGVVPKVLWDRTNPADDKNRIQMVTRNLLITGEDKVILIDSGNGEKWDDKSKNIYAMTTENRLLNGLNERGYQGEDVTHVINTHLHFDHAGGNTYLENGEIKATFPNARYIVHARHLDWAEHPTPRDQASFMPENWDILKKNGQILAIKKAVEILPGIFLHIVNGHTPYQILPRISDGKETLLFCGDLIPLASQTKIPWVMGYDLFPLKTVEEKQELLHVITEYKWWLAYEHDADTAFSKVAKTDKGFMAVEKMDAT